jgi:hypothetical protein
MELVLGTQQLIRFGGSETYLTTVAEQLQSLGHEVTVSADEQGESAEYARRRGVRVTTADHELPTRCDAVLVQDRASACELADRYPGVPHVFVMHSDVSPNGAPPQLEGVTTAVVALSDRTERCARALAHRPELVRLTQPIDTERLVPAGPLHDAPQRVLVARDGIRGLRPDLLIETWAEIGLECLDSPGLDMARADIVVGQGRAILEAMARGRAAYVLGPDGCDGWVTAERYASLEADGFAGRADPGTLDRERLRGELAAYRAEMGIVNRDLVAMHHGAGDHAQRLVELLGRGASTADAESPRLNEMARLVRESWMLESSVASMRGQLEELGAELARCRQNLDNAKEIVGAHTEFVQTRRYRLALALGRPADWLRGVRRGGSDG